MPKLSRGLIATINMMLLFRVEVISFYIQPSAITRSHSLGRKARAFQEKPLQSQQENSPPPSSDLLIHWKGEGIEGYSMQFRHIEFEGALAAVMGTSFDRTGLLFSDALSYNGSAEMPESKLLRFNQAMQYVTTGGQIDQECIVAAVKRSSLVHAVYEIMCEADTYEGLEKDAVLNNAFADMRPGEANENSTWCVRVRHYGQRSDSEKEKRYGYRARSLTKEKEALRALTPLLKQFGGRVDLDDPDCKIYVFDGLTRGKALLTRRMATGPSVSVIAPNTRICVTNTPLCPIAAFNMCNVAGIRHDSSILDPFAGSCATLLAAALIEPTCQTVGIEIAHDGLVNRNDIRKDFTSRELTEPVSLIHGDCTDARTRQAAREAIGNKPFDLIITDPPYGIRESKLAVTPINELLRGMANDRAAGSPLLARGGKLVCFLPCQEGEDFDVDILPSKDLLDQAGLCVEIVTEQPLNEKLSRWLVSFQSIC